MECLGLNRQVCSGECTLHQIGISVISSTSVIHPARQLCCVINNKFCPVFPWQMAPNRISTCDRIVSKNLNGISCEHSFVLRNKTNKTNTYMFCASASASQFKFRTHWKALRCWCWAARFKSLWRWRQSDGASLSHVLARIPQSGWKALQMGHICCIFPGKE